MCVCVCVSMYVGELSLWSDWLAGGCILNTVLTNHTPSYDHTFLMAVSVATSPVVMVTPPTLTVDLGLPFSLNCTATGQPVVRLRWLLEGISVGVSGPVLDVEHARESDTGEYTCEAMNDSGVGRAQSTVVVRCT